MARPRGKYSTLSAPAPAERTPPFLLTLDGPDLVLIAPFPKRPRGPTPGEAALVQAVTEQLRNFSVWIDPRDGTATPATIGEGQLQRRMLDCASFNVRTG